MSLRQRGSPLVAESTKYILAVFLPICSDKKPEVANDFKVLMRLRFDLADDARRMWCLAERNCLRSHPTTKFVTEELLRAATSEQSDKEKSLVYTS